jgi:hypothetical protein
MMQSPPYSPRPERMYFDPATARVFESKLVVDDARGRVVFVCMGCDEPANLPLDGVATHDCACGTISTWDGGERRFTWAVPTTASPDMTITFTGSEGDGDLSAWDDADRFDFGVDTP